MGPYEECCFNVSLRGRQDRTPLFSVIKVNRPQKYSRELGPLICERVLLDRDAS